MDRRWLVLGAVWVLAFSCPASASSEFTRLHSFGFAESAAANPYARLIVGTDGVLYGTTTAGGEAGQGTVFRIGQDGSSFRLLKSFGNGSGDAVRPLAGLLEGTNGTLYGTTEAGGQFGSGTIFQINKDGSGFKVLKSFSGVTDGAYPEAGLLEGSDGLLYGTASGGGTNDNGVVFRLGPDGSGFTPLILFSGTNGANPESELIEASDGLLYGTTCSNGVNTNFGTIFRLQKNGTGFSVLKIFSSTGSNNPNGAAPQARLIEGTNGTLYGTTSSGGTNGTGTIYQLNKDGSAFTTLYHFGTNSSLDGRIPLGDLIIASDGLLYGTTYDGGTNGNGTVFRIDPSGTGYAVVTSLVSPQGAAAGLVEATNGLLFGTSQLGGDTGDGTVFRLQKDGSAFSIIESLSASGADGQSPYSAPVQTSSSALVGTTRTGGDFAAGTVYSMRLDGLEYTRISSLEGSGQAISPVGSLLEATNRLLYGVSQFGGISNNGTVFVLDRAGTNFGLVHSAGDGSDGRELRGTLIQASDGELYGSAVSGGSNGQGTVFRVNTNGSGYTVLMNFAFGATGPGANPTQPLLEASDRVLYGTTSYGGTTNRGVVFRLTKDGSAFTVLKSFGKPAADGECPMSPLLEASDGMLYGSTYGGGTSNNAGTIFHLNRDGSGFGVIVAFQGIASDGRHPSGGLVEWTDGRLYGTTERGGVNDAGTLFRVQKNGSGYEVLKSLGGTLGSYPRGGLTQGPDDALYGSTDQGGDRDFGTVFRYGPQFGEIVKLQIINDIPRVEGIGHPGTNYTLQQTLQLGPKTTWSSIFSINAPANGKLFLSDLTAPGGGQAFYRLMW